MVVGMVHMVKQDTREMEEILVAKGPTEGKETRYHYHTYI